MANRYANPVLFAMEPNLTILSARVTFGATGIPTLDTTNSKGVCNFAVDAVAFNANSVGSSATLSSVTSFAGLYNGMTLAGGLAGTVSSITAGSGLITLASGTGVPTTNGGILTATGGRFRLQLGTQAAVRLDTYYKLLSVNYSWDMSSSSAAGSASVQALAPAAPNVFIAQNNTRVRTIPGTATTASTDCSLVIQMGNSLAGAGGNFTAKDPVAGEALRIYMVFGNSSAI